MPASPQQHCFNLKLSGCMYSGFHIFHFCVAHVYCTSDALQTCTAWLMYCSVVSLVRGCTASVLQRRHYIMALKRTAYLKRGANYTPAATLLRCVRPDQSSATVRCHYLTDGAVNFAFTMRRAEYFIPVGILLKCFIEVRKQLLRVWVVPCLVGQAGCLLIVTLQAKASVPAVSGPAGAGMLQSTGPM